jgi:DNA-3-methyladenine glycosylase I
VARYRSERIEKLMKNEGIVRNRLKIESAVRNASVFLDVQAEFGSFDTYIWQFVGGRPKQNAPRTLKDVPSNTPDSDEMSRDLRKRGFTFVGSTVCYAFMQATGMVNDHVVDCFRHHTVQRMGRETVDGKGRHHSLD